MNTETIINKQRHIIGMKRGVLLLAFLVTIMQINLISAVGDIGIIKQNECIDLTNFCPTCSYINLTAVQYPNGITENRNDAMTKSDNNYNFTFCDTSQLGGYSYTTCGDKAGVVACEKITFESSPSGRGGSSNIALVIILITIIYTITFVSFFYKNIPLSVLTGMIMTFFGVWIVRNGIVIYRDNLTNYFGYVTIAIGAIIALWAAVEWMEEIF